MEFVVVVAFVVVDAFVGVDVVAVVDDVLAWRTDCNQLVVGFRVEAEVDWRQADYARNLG